MTSVPEIDYWLTGVGWAACRVRFGDEQCEFSASYLSDALGKLVLGAAAIAQGVHGVSIGFDEEPGEFRWSVVHESAIAVRVTILSFPDAWSHRPDAEGESLLTFTCAGRRRRAEPLTLRSSVPALRRRLPCSTLPGAWFLA